MIDGKIKQKLLDEIQKFGNVFVSCSKVGVSKATYYRWKKNEKFKEQADEAERAGRENITGLAEHMLLQNIKKGIQRAIEYALNHNSPHYAPKPTTVLHSNPEKEETKRLKEDLKRQIDESSEGYRKLTELTREIAILHEEEAKATGGRSFQPEFDALIEETERPPK